MRPVLKSTHPYKHVFVLNLKQRIVMSTTTTQESVAQRMIFKIFLATLFPG